MAGRLADAQSGGDRPSEQDENFDEANLPTRKEITNEEAANKLNVSPRSVRTAKSVLRDAEPPVVEAVERGTVRVSDQGANLPLDPEITNDEAADKLNVSHRTIALTCAA